MKRNFGRLAAVVCLLLPLFVSVPAFSQGLYATVSGTVSDSSGAVIPGVTIKATAVDTGVVSTQLTNEAGVYNYRDLVPGKYTISASLPGFQTKTLTDVSLGQNGNYRYNFQLTVSSVATQVEVTVSAETILSTQGGTVGQVLSQEKVSDLPYVGNNVLDLITVMAGVENVVPTNPPSAGNAFGRENTTFAGVRADNVMIVRDGINMNDNRSPNGIYSIQTINPDLVGEIRLILAPVDVEMGRGNGSIQYSTRSGTNKFNGSAVWSFRNTALDPNTWANNRSQTIPAGAPDSLKLAASQGTADLAQQPNWVNTHQVTVSYGGPIIKNKTFFFALVDFNANHMRSLDNVQVYTPCARMGIFRYYDGWNSTNAIGTENFQGATPVRIAADLNGNPIAPTGPPASFVPPTGTTYDSSLQYRSIFGPLQSKPTQADCSDAPINQATLVPNGVSVTGGLGTNQGGWDNFRRTADPSGYVFRQLAGTPLPNNYEIGDGLNTAGFRWLRRSRGVDNLFGSGEATGIRKQFNVKIDHNFTANHKANVNWSYERTVSDDVFHGYPDGFSNSNFRHPLVITAGFTSTLSPTLLNEARFGYRLQDLNVIAPMALPEDQAALSALFPAPVNGIKVVPFFGFVNSGAICPLHYGARPPTNAAAPGVPLGCSISPTSKGKTPTWTASDTISWTHGAHAFRFNGELRLNSSKTETPGTVDFVGTTTYAAATFGSITGSSTAPGTTGVNDFAPSNSRAYGTDPNNLKGLQNSTTAGTGLAARNLMNYFAGSLSGLSMQYYLDNPNLSSPPQPSDWRDFRNNEFITTTVIQTEFSTWAKDEWKVTRNLTLTPGIRWDYTGVPYLDNGTTVGLVGGGASAFGISGRDFTGWMNPGARSDLTSFQFVGPDSPDSGASVYPNIYHNFGPSFAFAYSLPWFGEGKTSIRGGYQITYSTGSPMPGGGRFSSYSTALSGIPGRTFLANANTISGVYLDLSTAGNGLNPNNLTTLLPVLPSVAPLQPQVTSGPRNQGLSVFDPNYKNPYVQNLTLSVTRTVNRNVTLDVRYIGTLSRSNYSTQDLNINNFRSNGLLQALDAVRRGDDANTGLLDQIFKGVNLCTSNLSATAGNCITAAAAGVGSYGPIDGVNQRAAVQIRAGGLGGNTLANLVNANYASLAGTISNFNYNWGSTTNSHVCAVNCGLPDPNPNNTTVGSALRLNGFPDNFVVTNPQFSSVTLYNNWGYNNYHSLQAQLSLRPIHGFSGSATYNWSKNLGLGALTDPTNRSVDYTNIGSNPTHSFRTNGTFELPMGPGKLLMGNSSGWVARALERWQMNMIYNLSSGAPTSITATSLLYGNGVPDVRHPVDFNKLAQVRWGIRNTPSSPFLEGRYFDNNDLFVTVDDPLCSGATTAQNLFSAAGPTGAPRCTLNAQAMVVPVGTPDSAPAFTLGAAQVPNPNGTGTVPDTRNVQIVLQHPQPGLKGNLGNNTINGLGVWRFDANLGKTFRISESKSLTVRFDAQNVLNHPQPGNPVLNINATDAFGNATPFGQITSKTGGRSLQGQLRLTF
jgi:Carboxypeptidase regulatory-like domain